MALRQLCRAVGGILVRDWRVYWRYPLNALFQLVNTICWFVPIYFLGLGFSSGGRIEGFEALTGTSDFMSFVILGSVLGNFVNGVFWGIGFSLKEEMTAGVLESNWLTPVPPGVQLLGRSLFSVITVVIESVVMWVLLWLLFGFHASGSMTAAILTAIPMLAALYGFGFALAGLVLLMRDANTLIDVSSFIVTLLSGSTVPVKVFPKALLVVSLTLPLTYGYDAVRGILLGTRTMLPLGSEWLILIGSMIVMVAAGLLWFRRIERRCLQRGTLGMH